ncbi:carboxylate-amine ligase [Rufibacter quisquiliarum]|uniref:Gamma-glutamyl:cysteine ligase YbdK (ATP-grasp superfamily) n=1 Tax=Rufibacter quisquiliarum TaxID=1549639 RepID=A0A839GEQ2_9BACT|nr:glutamate-cysteine ligase family protein [Rufibacter quisquiliarum]MBA9077392.1 gamma-glutamyl:cysteine ligase YbdK (ATP-grasp superfamily) [Rufibacter quisquiliarum]
MNNRLGLFQGFGVEMEYMIVDRDNLQVKPISDEVLKAEAGELTSDVERGDMAWSNELVLHVLELKTNGPAPCLSALSEKFYNEVQRVNQLLARHNAMLLPTGAHPFMNPYHETKLWPHESSEIYQAYNKVFDCQGHGWSNLQSTHLNLPFANDEEFGRLHAAIRLVLPLIPALSAASPVLDGQVTGFLDSRLEVYRKNQQKIPLIAGEVVPEAVFSEQAYQEQIFLPMFKAIAPYDPEGILQEEFLNSRGAITRFSRGAIEIRIIDNQECPLADIAIVSLVTEVLKRMVGEEWASYAEQQQVETSWLASVFLQSVKNGPETEITQPSYLRMLGMEEDTATLKQVWQHLWQEVKASGEFTDELSCGVEIMLNQGCLSQRLLKALGENPGQEALEKVYRQLADCLAHNKLFEA